MGGPTSSISYRQHSSWDHVTTQAPPLRQSTFVSQRLVHPFQVCLLHVNPDCLSSIFYLDCTMCCRFNFLTHIGKERQWASWLRHQWNQYIHVTDDVSVMSLSASLLQKISAATHRLYQIALKRKLSRKFEKCCKFSIRVKARSRNKKLHKTGPACTLFTQTPFRRTVGELRSHNWTIIFYSGRMG
jgi:hypothetical protein